MKFKISALIFFAFYMSVSLAQDNTSVKSTEAKNKSPQVGNFPSREAAKKSWDKQEPPQKSSSDGGPDTGVSPGSTSTKTVTAKALPNPKIDVVTEAINETSPMNAEQLRQFKDEMLKRSKELTTVPGGPYEINGTRMVSLNFAPGSKVETVNVGLGMGASVQFLDRRGSPIAIDAVKAFSPAFSVGVQDVETEKNSGSSSFYIEANSVTGAGNVIIRLVDIPNPIMLRVEVGKSDRVDGVVQAIVPHLVQSNRALPGERAEADNGLYLVEMQAFLAGIPVDGAVEINVKNVAGVTAWMWHEKLYVRTIHTIFSPGYFRRQAAADGTAVYEMPLTSLARMGMSGKEVEVQFEYPFIPQIRATKGAK